MTTPIGRGLSRDEALARTDLAALLEEVGAGRGLYRQHKMYPCPSLMHEQTGATPPASIGPDGKVWRCHSCQRGGSAIDALVESGRAADVADALAQLGVHDAEPGEAPRVVATYDYVDEGGKPLYRVLRYVPKTFRQQRWTPSGWEWGLGDTPRVLYHLPRVREAIERKDWLFLVEGEKDVEAIEAAGFYATTMPGGAGKWREEYTASLSGARVIIIADDDEAGRAHAFELARILYGRVDRVAVRAPQPPHKDIADHLAAGLTMKQLVKQAVLHDLPPQTTNGNGLSTFTARVFAARSGSSKDLEVLGPMFVRGMRTAIGAQTGEGKTSFAIQAIRCLLGDEPFLEEPQWRPRRTGRALIVDLEQGEETVKARLCEAGLDTSDAVDILWEPSGIALDRREEDRAMVRDVLKEGGYDLVVMDPLYQTHLGSGNDEQVAAAVMRIIDGWAREFNISLVIPMHARKPHPDAGKNFTIHDIAGVGTWLRNAEFVLGLQLMSAGQSRLWFFKDRIGRGPTIRTHWWMDFDRENGFRRNHREEKNRIRAEMKALLGTDEGTTRDALLAIEGAYDTLVQEVLRQKNIYEYAGRYRSTPWEQAGHNPGQTSLE